MFTLKFYSNSSGEDYWNVISSPNYNVALRAGGAIVSVYPTIGGEQGVDFQVGMGARGYDSLFIENASGKTIDRIGPFEAQTVAA